MDLSNAKWHKSSWSDGTGGTCVEAATNLPGIVAVRDSKNRGAPALVFSHEEWRAFLRHIRNGQTNP